MHTCAFLVCRIARPVVKRVSGHLRTQVRTSLTQPFYCIILSLSGRQSRIARIYTLEVITTPFIGRSQEITEIGERLDDPSCRLLTLVGPGGIGKTRLAEAVASYKRDAFPDGIFFVSLAPLNHAADLLTAIAQALPFGFQQDLRDPREQFFAYLHERHAQRLLLILDNFEHLLDGAEIVSEILAATGGLKILVTSREALNLQEEWLLPVEGLAYPARGDGEAHGRLEDYGAVQLFLPGQQERDRHLPPGGRNAAGD
jgi:predicted ATPase